ncbi:hypothetical protein AB3R30_04300 [Leptolyngbyaceae cyanobacterium UHCC 1019]
MRAYEFPAKVTADGQLELPPELQVRLRHRPSVRVIVLLDESDDESENWATITAKQFLSGYSAADEVYDRL